MQFEQEFSRTPEELAALYSLELAEQDIYVEGVSDRVIIEYYLNSVGLGSVKVYEINSVNIPYKEFIETGMPDGNRSRVIYLSSLLDELSEVDLRSRVICIADTDFDALYNKIIESRLLLFTDTSSIELYLLNPKIIKKMLSLGLKRPNIDEINVLNQLIKLLRFTFLVKAVCQELNFNITLPSIDKECKVINNIIYFNEDSYINKVLQKASRWQESKGFRDRIQALDNPLLSDTLAIDGHHFLELLHYFLEKIIKPKKGFEEELFIGIAFSSLEISDLESYNLFKEIYQRLAA